ncbi:maleylpyruvate isomerase family mycothiol-dependent enzyme [Kibdelosporangium philippinense]|uniref:Maleylpyruvate isomerase family mycothiol-dependent enzyme n=1 Tax=Kibdelosporangium philippinense TaxID=211113 RepID=A0ABS8Z7E3_9PSEU|nr:maleylpyruvate isomerase family mycothiol-dependent enzyme [Kibdelosporangium philippinense]MCE7003803.1 maleylpyruvate isomerase family mycothiol-dependent enzyme [Kibdelosporangium philippinense]
MAVNLNVIFAGHARLANLIAGLTDSQTRADSALPGWSRGHVLTHLAEHAKALKRQASYALDGKLVDMYDGGLPRRAADIEAGSSRPASVLVDEVVQSAKDLETTWAAVGPEDWARPVKYRDGTLEGTFLARWREVEIHSADLNLGPVAWSPEFCDYIIDFMAPRVPPGISLVLPDRTLGVGEPVRVAGDLPDIAAWLAGRGDDGVTVTRPTELGPWP